MIIKSFKTPKITVGGLSLTDIVDRSIKSVEDGSILAVTSKIVSICEGSVVRVGTMDKQTLIETEAERYIPMEKSKYNISLTIKDNMLIPTAGIDESNGNGYYILWPKHPFETASEIRSHIVRRYNVTAVGVIITDSKTTPMRWGTTGTSLGHSGFEALKNYIGSPDVFGRNLHVTKANIADGLAAAAVAVMGEGKEQTPLALISDVPFVQFNALKPTKKDRENLIINPQDDLYMPLIEGAKWKKGKG